MRAIDPVAALESTSWGLFQILGYHAADLDYSQVERFVEAMGANERAHLDAFARFIGGRTFEGRTLVHWLRERDWGRFARAYNGPGYAKNKYNAKLKEAYAAAVAAQSVS